MGDVQYQPQMQVPIFDINLHDVPRTKHCLVVDLDHTFVSTNKYYDEIRRLDTSSIESRTCSRDSLDCAKFLEVKKRLYDVHTIDSVSALGSGIQQSYWGVERPLTQNFLPMADIYFDIIAVRSAGVNEYVHSISDHLFRNIRRPVLVLDRLHVDFDKGNNVIKPLTRMYEHCQFHYGECNANFSKFHTFVLDDTASTFRQNPENGILIPPYEPGNDIESLAKPDDALLKLARWLLLEPVVKSEDVRHLDKSRIFN